MRDIVKSSNTKVIAEAEKIGYKELIVLTDKPIESNIKMTILKNIHIIETVVWIKFLPKSPKPKGKQLYSIYQH